MTLELRSYQRQAIDDLYGAFRAGMQCPLAVLPTGAGKSVVLAKFIQEILAQWPDQRILMLVHVRELVAQNLKALLAVWPGAPVTVYSAGLKSRDMSGQIVFGSIQSLYKRGFDLQKVDLIIVDEAHLIQPSGDGMYRRLLADLAACNGGQVPMAGFTATGFRTTTGSLVEGTGRVFDGIAHETGILELIEAGYLVRPVTKATATKLDVRGVHTRGGEYIQSELQDAVDREEITEQACDEIVAAGRDRRSWLCFSTGLDHGFHIRDALRRRGIRAEMVTGETPLRERDQMIAAFRDGYLRALVNDSVLTTGFDAPCADLLAVLRPTQSPGLWVQICGRGLRLSPGKEDCKILDFGGNAMRHGPLDTIRGEAKGESGGMAPVKICPGCESIVPAGVLECPDCGHQFPPRERQMHDAKAGVMPMLSDESPISDWLPVSRVALSRHQKVGGEHATLRCDYRCGFVTYSEWICIEHPSGSVPWLKAAKWWVRRNRNGSIWTPPTVAEALTRVDDLRDVAAIRVIMDGRWWRVADVRFTDQGPPG